MDSALPAAAAADAGLPPLAQRWREIQGLHRWKGLLQPLDVELRENVIRYGEFNQAIYDAFDAETHSKYVGTSKYRKEELFQKVGLQTEDRDWGYEVSRYLYATATSHILGRFFLSSSSKESWSKESNWIGYVAVATDKGKEWLGRRDIVVVWRGTLRLFEWIDDFHAQQSDAADFLPPDDDDNEEDWYRSLQNMAGKNRELFDFEKRDASDLFQGTRDIQQGGPQHHQTQKQKRHWYDQLLRRKDSGIDNADDSGDHKKLNPQIEKGWLLIYTSTDERSPYVQHSARDQVLNELRYLLKKYEDEDVSITVVGHSLGASLAVLNAYDIAENKLNVRKKRSNNGEEGKGGGREAAQAESGESAGYSGDEKENLGNGDAENEEEEASVLVTAVVFGCPLVGDADFKERCEQLPGLRILRVKNKRDLIALYPPTLMGYREVGEELLVDHRLSSYLKDSRTIGDWHNLEAHLHLVAGTHGPDLPFELAVDRDPALINKSCDFLKEDFHIPASWWQDQYKGLARDPISGLWQLPDRHPHHVPQPEPMHNL